MSGPSNYLAIDLGAESGRAVLGRLHDGRLSMQEVHRFANEPVRLGDVLHWDFPRLFLEIREGIRRAGQEAGGRLEGIAVDSWGVDFGLIDSSGDLLGLPVHYRDERTSGTLDEVFQVVPREEIFDATGLQFLELNTLVQLVALRRRSPHLLDMARWLLPTADLVAYFLSGHVASELTLASTTQLLDARTRNWSDRLIEAFELPRRIFPDVVEPGTPLAPLREDLASELGLASTPPVIACGSHDTASAVAAVPATGSGSWGYLSSGTWSLIGVELDAPHLAPDALEYGFTNEAGVFSTTRFLKNIIGLWLVQECRRQWAREGNDLDYGTLAELAERAPPARAWIDPDDPIFFTPGDMPARIREACRETGQSEPESPGDIVRCTLESLARVYRRRVEEIQSMTGQRLERLHVVGGGSRLSLLNRLTAEALGIPVIAGPVEATSLGNILLQAKATGELDGLDAMREVVRHSVELETFEPGA